VTKEEKEIRVRMKLSGFDIDSKSRIDFYIEKCPYDHLPPKQHTKLSNTYLARDNRDIGGGGMLLVRPCTRHIQRYLDIGHWIEI
jgi:hypothetical protein